MILDDELATFYRRSGFGDVVGARPRTVHVYTGCLLVPMPNIETRRRYLKYHDLHHLVTGYSVGRIGEGEVSAWELGTRSLLESPMLGVMNFVALSTGLVLEPRRMWRAFRSGRRSRNLYAAEVRAAVDAGHWPNVEALRYAILEVRLPPVPRAVDALEFASYSTIALLIHFSIAIPAVIVRVITDLSLGYSFFQVVKPAKRVDLY
jgi:hypothetical protein